MSKTLGLDLGTNSIGWAIVDDDAGRQTLRDRGVVIFQEGVLRGKNGEQPSVKERTDARALRRHYFRRRLRKIAVLKLLVKYDLCPPLTDEQLGEWKSKKRYPLTDDFILWQRTDDNTDKNPYRDRYRALTSTLDLDRQQDRYSLGRAMYHLSQRRGFLSGRKDAEGDSEIGAVKEGIKDLTSEMEAAGCTYLGEYFYRLYRNKEKIRRHYTSRKEHYEKEFNAICHRQHLPDEWRKALHHALFYQRPLRSQKGTVGKCTFERAKSRCPVSHPRFEEFRMLQFVNNIRVTTPDSSIPRPLTSAEIEGILPLFLRKSKPHFDFEDIAKKLAGKGRYACKDDRTEAPYRFNFPRGKTVSGCPVTAALAAVFGDDWISEARSLYLLGEGKSEEQVVNDIWHALFSFDDEERLEAWAREKLQLDPERAHAFASIHPRQDYAQLSLKAINKILPFLRRGYRYDEAVFLANLRAVLPPDVGDDSGVLRKIESDIAALLEEYRQRTKEERESKEQVICRYLAEYHGIDEQRLKRLYHPSMIETYPAAQPNEEGLILLGSPRTSSVRNPMAMRALHKLRALINRLLHDGKIDPQTKIGIEFARGLNDANRRKAIEHYQREREAEHRKFAEEIRKQYEAATGAAIEPTDDDILKYRLWEEQNHICLYKGNTIRICDFIGSNPLYDYEHTVPRSRDGDDSQMNKTLCEKRFNREIKRTQLPSELSNHAEILARIESLGWNEEIASLQKQIEGQIRKAKNAATKSEKDRAIQRRHELQMQLDYWRGKYERFTMTEVPENFSKRQGVDVGIISRYARHYLASVFADIYTVKGATTADFRKMWGLQKAYEKKERTNHAHHCIDAITIACISRKANKQWTDYCKDEERYLWQYGERPVPVKPWPTFTEDVQAVADELLIAHRTPDPMPKPTRKRLRIRGRVQRNERGEEKYAKGDSARGSLHQQTFYGAIRHHDTVKYVLRRPLDELRPQDVAKIVDEEVRRKVEETVAKEGFSILKDPAKTVWMNEEKGVPIRKVRLFTTVTQPTDLKKHRDLSPKEYKQHYHVTNAGNYCMAIYEGADKKGKIKRTFEIVSNLEAAKYFKASADKTARGELVPISDPETHYPMKYLLKAGTMVLFYEHTPEELYDCSPEELAKRLYKVTGLSTMTIQGKYKYGTIAFRHHGEARPSVELKEVSGEWKIGEKYRPAIGMNHNQPKALIEGKDFELTITGEIRFKNDRPC